jgi:DNA-directed RNA polymerase specialized sigma24 family protein
MTQPRIDDILLARVRAGDIEALAELHGRYSLHCALLAHGASPSNPVEVAVEVWLAAWRSPPASDFAAWLTGSVVSAEVRLSRQPVRTAGPRLSSAGSRAALLPFRVDNSRPSRAR